jgi:hypothetical protein
LIKEEAKESGTILDSWRDHSRVYTIKAAGGRLGLYVDLGNGPVHSWDSTAVLGLVRRIVSLKKGGKVRV